jgi:hypothetical protein
LMLLFELELPVSCSWLLVGGLVRVKVRLVVRLGFTHHVTPLPLLVRRHQLQHTDHLPDHHHWIAATP